jgi:CspA family cold shock protein
MRERRPGFFRYEESPSGRKIDARVKWFNAAKGFGFVSPADGGQDAFLPMAAIRRAGLEEIREGAALICEIGVGVKGPVVLTILSIDNSTAPPAPAGVGFVARRSPTTPPATVEGAVKWFEAQKGFGFISLDGGGKDVFVHIGALRRSGLETLEPAARVRVDVVEGKKGLEAERLEIIR